MHFLFEPGFFTSGPVRTAAVIGALTAVVSAVVGVFTVVRSQSFAGHALTDVATTGGSGAFLLGLSPLTGFIAGGVVGGGAMEMIGVERARSRDVATGIVLGAATGCSALFLYLDTTRSATTGATQQILFGSIFTIDPSTVPTIVILDAATLLGIGVIHRPLLLGSVSADLASARGISLRVIGLLFMLALAVAVGLSSIAIGSILSTALLIGPAATALRITRSLPRRDGGRLLPRNLDHVARHPLGVRQRLVGPLQSGTPRQLLHRGDRVPSVSRIRPALRPPTLRPSRRGWTPTGGVSAATRGRVAWGSGLMFSGFMVNAWEVGTIVAIVAGVVGFFVVLRGSAFPAHAIPNGAFAGAAGANLIGINPLVGLGVFSLLAALGIGSLSRRGRADVVTALVLVMMLALGAAFLSQSTEYEPQIFSLLFGEILGVSSSKIVPVAILGLVSIVAIAVLYRRLVLNSIAPEIATARGIQPYRTDMAFLVVLACATTMTVPVVGALLIFTLMIGPPAAARCFTDRPGLAIAGSVVLALFTVWAALASSYEFNWPVGFFVGAFSAAWYGLGRIYARWRRTSAPRGSGTMV